MKFYAMHSEEWQKNTKIKCLLHQIFFNSIMSDSTEFVTVKDNGFRDILCVVAATSENVGFIAGGDELKVVGNRGLYKEEDILLLSKKWWEYWNDYWKKRETNDAYEKDYACEVTIPIKE